MGPSAAWTDRAFLAALARLLPATLRAYRKPVLGGLINEYTYVPDARKARRSPTEPYFEQNRISPPVGPLAVGTVAGTISLVGPDSGSGGYRLGTTAGAIAAGEYR